MTAPSHDETNAHAGEIAQGTCPVSEAHDRLIEASHFLYQMEQDYHDPQKFRFNLNAFISSLRATPVILQQEVERQGKVRNWNKERAEFQEAPLLGKIFHACNIALHQKTIYDGSQIEAGLFRGRQLKLALDMHVSDDRTSQQILEQLQTLENPFVDRQHTAIAEQLGVRRRYLIKEISSDQDALTASQRAFARMTRQLDRAHKLFGTSSGVMEEEVLVQQDHTAAVTVLLESDLDPSLPEQWGWDG